MYWDEIVKIATRIGLSMFWTFVGIALIDCILIFIYIGLGVYKTISEFQF